MVGWHHRLDGHEFEQAPGVGDGQGGLVHRLTESDTTEWLNNSNMLLSEVMNHSLVPHWELLTGDRSSGPHCLPAPCPLATFLSRWQADESRTVKHAGVKGTLLPWLILRKASGNMPESSLQASPP